GARLAQHGDVDRWTGAAIAAVASDHLAGDSRIPSHSSPRACDNRRVDADRPTRAYHATKSDRATRVGSPPNASRFPPPNSPPHPLPATITTPAVNAAALD